MRPVRRTARGPLGSSDAGRHGSGRHCPTAGVALAKLQRFPEWSIDFIATFFSSLFMQPGRPSGHPLPCKLNDRSMQAVSRLQTDGCGILHEQPADQAGRYFDRDQDFVPGRESRYDMECAIASQRSAIPAASPVLSFTRETDRSVGCPETRRAAMRNLRDAGARDWKTSGHLFRLTGHGVYGDAGRAIPGSRIKGRSARLHADRKGNVAYRYFNTKRSKINDADHYFAAYSDLLQVGIPSGPQRN